MMFFVKKVLEMYKTIYYWIYYYLTKVRTNDDPAFNSLMIIILLEGCNLISIGRLVFKANHLFLEKQNAIILGSIVVVGLMVFNYFYLYHSRSVIFETARAYKKSKTNLTKFIFWLYVVGSMAFFYSVIIYS